MNKQNSEKGVANTAVISWIMLNGKILLFANYGDMGRCVISFFLSIIYYCCAIITVHNVLYLDSGSSFAFYWGTVQACNYHCVTLVSFEQLSNSLLTLSLNDLVTKKSLSGCQRSCFVEKPLRPGNRYFFFQCWMFQWHVRSAIVRMSVSVFRMTL